MKVLILGAGVYGQALGQVLVDNAHEISFYDPFTRKISIDAPGNIIIHSELTQALSDAPEIIVLCTPSNTVKELLPNLPTGIPLIVATKGILNTSIFNEFDYMVLSGAGFAEDIIKRKETRLTATDGRIIELFTTDYLTFDETSDAKGVLLCGALKNIYALGAGLRNLTPKTDDWESYIKSAAHEMEQILTINDAEPETLQLSCGVGDLILTCGPRSRNYNYGKRLHDEVKSGSRTIDSNNASRGGANRDDINKHGSNTNTTVEGLSAITEIRNGIIKLPENLPVLNWIINQLKEGAR